MYMFRPSSSVVVTQYTSLFSDNFSLLLASQSSCLAACAIQARLAEETQFGSAQLPTDWCYSSHCHSLWDFLLTSHACWDAGWDCVSRHNSLNLVLLVLQQTHGDTIVHLASPHFLTLKVPDKWIRRDLSKVSGRTHSPSVICSSRRLGM